MLRPVFSIDNGMESLNISPAKPSADDERFQNTTKVISKAALVNKLNYINFSDRTILVTFLHDKYGTTFSLKAKPLPCSGERLECVWSDTPDTGTLRLHTFQNIMISDGYKCLKVYPRLVIVNEYGISMMLPETCQELLCRKMGRYSCQGVRAQISQHGALYIGRLVDVSPVSFSAHVSAYAQQSFQWLNSDLPVNLQLYAEQNLLYSGDCWIVREDCRQAEGVFVLHPLNTWFQRFKPKKFRSSRHRLNPSPNIIFQHPLSGTIVNLKVLDLSGSGFSVEEKEADSLLFAGLLIPELELQFSHRFCIKCQAQVVYRSARYGTEKGSVRCGMTILDMDMNDQVSLLSSLSFRW